MMNGPIIHYWLWKVSTRWSYGDYQSIFPRYSEDLGAAFEMLRHLIGETSETYARVRAFFVGLGKIDGSVHVVVSWNDFADLTAEKLCVMALRAMGYGGGAMNELKEHIAFLEAAIANIEERLSRDEVHDAMIDIKSITTPREVAFRFAVSGPDDRLQVCRMWHRPGLPLYRVGDRRRGFLN